MKALPIFVSVVACWSLLPGPAGAQAARIPQTFRAGRPWIERLLSAAVAQAPTVARLKGALDARRLVIYVDEAGAASDQWSGRLRFIGRGGDYRYLQIELRPHAFAFAAAMLAHEMQHAVEVVSADVSSQSDFAALFRRIGFAVAGSGAEREQFDTEAAVTAGLDTVREITGRPARPSARTAEAMRCARRIHARTRLSAID